MMPARHEEYSAVIGASPAEVFSLLDNHTRLAAHMTTRSWKLGWGRMDVRLDAAGGRAVGSHIVLDGRVFGIRLYLDEVVTERDPPIRKRWRTVGDLRLLVVDQYTMGFDIAESDGGTRLRVLIDYELPVRGFPKILGWLFGRMYARWCTRRMMQDAQRAFTQTARLGISSSSRITTHT